MRQADKIAHYSLRLIKQGIREGAIEASKLGIQVDQAYFKSLLQTLKAYNIVLADIELAEALGVSMNTLKELKSNV